MRFAWSLLACCAAAALSRRTTYAPPALPPPTAFRVFLVPDMEGMGSAVDIREVIRRDGGRGLQEPHQRRLLATPSAGC